MNFKKNENKGFSLVELIVVIAIMAVLTSVLAPALLQYVERSRAQKDSSAMGEVANAIRIALADEKVYDECLDNRQKKTTTAGSGVATGYATPDMAGDASLAATDMTSGFTITFYPTDGVVSIGAGRFNEVIRSSDDGSGAVTVESCPELAAQVKATIGPDVKLTSQSYRNSEYTVFVAMDNVKDGIKVTGEWNGKNVPDDAYPTGE